MPTAATHMLTHRHLIDLNDLSREDIEHVLSTCRELRREGAESSASRLRGRTMANLFYENSTRTKSSFQQAAFRLGATVINFDPATSSAQKGESIRETIRTLEAVGAEYVVLRHPSSGIHRMLTQTCAAHLINAGDGMSQHPTQGLLDLLTIHDALGRLDVRVAIVGDILHSRVARSAIAGLKKFGASIIGIGPRTLAPESLTSLGIEVGHDLRRGIEGADIVMSLRIQQERMTSGLITSTREYNQKFGLSQAILNECAPRAFVMHPGPVNIGVELTRNLLVGERSLVEKQVENGVTVRMAVLCLVRD